MANRKRGYIEVDIDTTERVYVDDILDQVEDDDILQECIDRKLIGNNQKEFKLSKETLSNYFCISRHTPIDKFVELVKNELETEV